MARKQIGAKARFDIFKRDGWTCRYCGARPPDALLHVDHVIPVKEGGGNEDENLVTSCKDCNLGKGARKLTERAPPHESPEDLKARTKQLKAYQKALSQWIETREEWSEFVRTEVWAAISGSTERTFMLSEDQTPQTLFFVQELGFKKVIELGDCTAAKGQLRDPFAYFAGCCWTAIRAREVAA